MSARAGSIKPDDLMILNALTPCGDATYVVRNRLSARGFNVETAWVLRRLKRLERSGYVKRMPTSYLVMISWAATECGAARP